MGKGVKVRHWNEILPILKRKVTKARKEQKRLVLKSKIIGILNSHGLWYLVRGQLALGIYQQ